MLDYLYTKYLLYYQYSYFKNNNTIIVDQYIGTGSKRNEMRKVTSSNQSKPKPYFHIER